MVGALKKALQPQCTEPLSIPVRSAIPYHTIPTPILIPIQCNKGGIPEFLSLGLEWSLPKGAIVVPKAVAKCWRAVHQECHSVDFEMFL